MVPSGRLIWPVVPPMPASAELNTLLVIPTVRVMVAGTTGTGGKPPPPVWGLNRTSTDWAVRVGLVKVRVSPAWKAAAWASVMVSKI